MEESFMEQLQQLRLLYAQAVPTDSKIQEQYAWIVCKAIGRSASEMGAVTCRQLLADVMRMPLARPSRLYSSILSSAMKVASLYPDFHVVPFLNIWGGQANLRPEDYEQVKKEDGKVFPSLAERMVRACRVAQLVRPEEHPNFSFSNTYGFHPVTPMVVTKVNQAEVKGRKMYFAQLTSIDGEVVEAPSNVLRPSPLAKTEGRHYVNVGQFYNVLLRDRQNAEGVKVVDAVLSVTSLSQAFPVVSGYVEHIDTTHGHVHIYDGLSRHFVSSGQRFPRVQERQFVQFVPVIPRQSKFKSAIILPTTSSMQDLAETFPLREIRITKVDTDNMYCAWELTDASVPVTEQLSPLQLSLGETSPSFVKGFVPLDTIRRCLPNVEVGNLLRAIIYLRRGKDKQKRPFVALALQA